MLARKETFLLALLCCVVIQMYSQPNDSKEDPFLIKMGQKQFVLEPNINDFGRIKKELKNNEYDGWYYVVVQFNEQPTQSQRAQMTGKINLIEPIGQNSFIAGFTTKIKKGYLKNQNVRAVIPLTDELKIDASLVNVQEDTTLVGIHVSNEIRKKFVKENIEALEGEYEMQMDRQASAIYSFKVPSV